MKKTKLRKKIKRVKNTNKETLSKKILLYLGEKSKEMLDLSVRIMFDFKSIRSEFGVNLYGNSYYLPREFYRLKKSPYFSYSPTEEKFYLTEKGRIKIIESVLRNKKMNQKRWDGFWRAIIFDIPEESRNDRDFLRKELRWIGCKEIQKSVWVTPFDFEKELMAILTLWKRDFRGNIQFLKIEKISGEEEIKQYFNI